MGQSNLSLYEIFFEIELNISESFPGLNPFKIRREKAKEVFLLIRRLNNYNHKSKKKKKMKIRKPASDSWF